MTPVSQTVSYDRDTFYKQIRLSLSDYRDRLSCMTVVYHNIFDGGIVILRIDVNLIRVSINNFFFTYI